MIWKNLLIETQSVKPEPMIRYGYLLAAADFIPDEAFSSGIVEVGCHQGGTSIRLGLLAKKHQLQKVHCIDVWEDLGTKQSKLENMSPLVEESFKENVKNHDLGEYICMIKGFSYDVGKTWNSPISFMILDGGHTYEDVKKDLSVWAQHIIPGGFLFMDDFGPWDGGSGPEGAAKELLLAPGIFKLVYQQNCFALLRKN